MVHMSWTASLTNNTYFSVRFFTLGGNGMAKLTGNESLSSLVIVESNNKLYSANMNKN